MQSEDKEERKKEEKDRRVVKREYPDGQSAHASENDSTAFLLLLSRERERESSYFPIVSVGQVSKINLSRSLGSSFLTPIQPAARTKSDSAGPLFSRPL